ncbi:hypothetical protein [Psychrobacter sp. APC 3350]|uniref:hypothetical protein n=1 Tax=Psychrobacter sp. APC 3350 TaxID=3035195 RepID=UPI0025B51C3C|nr:hypothetical protein [Psychrobacter sp. APC 3350]MDN3454082.1 hypothetical protein [Psychrobacter sp. APC 3350]
MSSDGIIEAPGIILLIACLLRISQYVIQSHVTQIKAFWLAAILIFVSVIRREWNYLPDLLVPSDFSLLSQSYDWWEDCVLTVIYLVALGLLAYSRHYLWAVLKNVPVSLYLSVTVLAIIQYMGENAIMFPHTFGEIVEELAETVIYGIALAYLWRFKLADYESCLVQKLNYKFNHANH